MVSLSTRGARPRSSLDIQSLSDGELKFVQGSFSNVPTPTCVCGSADLSAVYRKSTEYWNCRACHSLMYFPKLRTTSGTPWEEPTATPQYRQALEHRRKVQAVQILDFAVSRRNSGRLLDYGCGQGVLLLEARRRDLAIFGCDLNPQVSNDRVSTLSGPWELPKGDWDMIFMLDVLEHHPNPSELLALLKTKEIVLKLPNANGPFATMARLLGRAGLLHLLRRLFLVNDASPHHWIPTRRGISALLARTGFSNIQVCSIPDVGLELPERLRMLDSPSTRPLRYGLRLLGGLMALAGKYWSDSMMLVASSRVKQDSGAT